MVLVSTDIDECNVPAGNPAIALCGCGTVTSPCTPTCTNTDGSYECGCSAGLQIGADGVTCEGIVQSRLLATLELWKLTLHWCCGISFIVRTILSVQTLMSAHWEHTCAVARQAQPTVHILAPTWMVATTVPAVLAIHWELIRSLAGVSWTKEFFMWLLQHSFASA